jgi:hypothetical protein
VISENLGQDIAGYQARKIHHPNAIHGAFRGRVKILAMHFYHQINPA